VTNSATKRIWGKGVNHGFNPADNFGLVALGRGACLAIQPKLGLRAERGNRIDSFDHPDSGAAARLLESLFNRREQHLLSCLAQVKLLAVETYLIHA
jgi:hypothetical protein